MDHIKSYVLRSGRMSDAQRRAYDNLRPAYCLPLGTPLDFTEVFGNRNPTIVEIGFGMGGATAIIAEQNRDRNYIGIEVHRPGVGKLLWEIENRKLENIRIIEGDAAEAMEMMIPDSSLAGIHVFFPDPWPKKRHHKRRLVKRPFTDLLAKKLQPQGYLYMITDWEDYAVWALEELTQTPDLENPYEGYAPSQPWRPATKFENKGLAEDRPPRELYFLRKNAETGGLG